MVFDAFGVEGLWFESQSSRHVGTLSKSFTRSCLYDLIHSFIHSRIYKAPLQEIYSEAPPATAIQISLKEPAKPDVAPCVAALQLNSIPVIACYHLSILYL